MVKLARRPGMGRLEAFSDAVLAIVLTLLVLELLPDGAQSPQELFQNWPTYLAFFAAFLTVGVVWLNHNEAVSRIRRADPIVQVLNLGLLLGASLMPWPTALISAALKEGDRTDQIAAICVFAIVTILISVPWLVLDNYLIRHRELLGSATDVPWMRAHARMSIATLLAAGISVALAFASPLASLVLYIIVVAAFLAVRLREQVTKPSQLHPE
ncbi:TMEM175 family protein [Leifsonia sp. 2MCAF36]|uniref:TMEM175 family protein n=1 Tax=Leifsonia sp. 2MCAF36 TaxID=3232988 RepID=UPI003F9B1552